ncbi:hypothetical protein L486_03638 [Kwoniella mangroviensis CBS 10435]|uniref:CSC1/OSCA1-like 7TM region domain-containing protein n=1 Tax=Kwoniella mangroviensis CBS 10435 TaxID=1331196 RepID=A0A1B9IUE5_9TREE|nr:hypothetical protein L486_03638 [Kwoniella mangroviensis CBS 10435]
MTSTTIYDPIITTPPSLFPLLPPQHQHRRRHFYLCGDETLSWESEWYTASFFTSARASYDSAASTGPVQPPTGIYQNVPQCAAILSSQLAEASSSALSAASASKATITEGARVITTNVISTFTSDGSTFASTVLRTTTIPITPSPTSTQTSSASEIATITPTAPASAITDPSSINTCAGDWDWQGWAVVAGLGSGLIIGGIMWLIWLMLRSKLPGIYAPRTWAISQEFRPSQWTFLTFLLPFLHLPSNALSEGASTLSVLFAGLKLSALVSLLALGGVLPMILAGVPCLSETSPQNNLGGRLGTLTDLSLLRLLNALDPSPDSAATSNTLRLMFSSSPLGSMGSRSLTSTIAPAISSARVRLIIVLVILAVLACGGGLFVIARTYASLIKLKKSFETRTCQKMEMVFISSHDAAGWKGKTEEGVRRLLRDWCAKMKSSNEEKEVDVLGVFAIPDTTDLKQKVEEREKILIELEVAETNYIASFKLTHTASDGDVLEPIGWNEGEPESQSTKNSSPVRPIPPDDFLAPIGFYKIPTVSHPQSKERLNVPVPPSLDLEEPGEASDSKFKEINRDSAMYGGRFDIGQRIKMDQTGNWVPDPSPQSEGTNELDTTPDTSHEGPTNERGRDSSDPPHSGEATRGLSTPPIISSPTSPGPPISPTSPYSPEELGQRPRMPTRSSHRVSREGTSPLAAHYASIRETRARFKELNMQIENMQKQKFAEIASTTADIKGWIVAGKGVRWLPYAELIEGYTREDILWQNAGASTGKKDEQTFWLKVLLSGGVLSIILIPFLALSVGTAPGFAHYLDLLKPLAKSDGFGSGVVEGLVPAVVLSMVVGVALYYTEGLSKDVKCISRIHQRLLAYKAVFHLLLCITVEWTVLVVALEYAVQGFAINVQESRTVGDGAVFSTWFVFVLLLNLAFVLPAVYLLQPHRLFKYLRERKKVITPRQRYRLYTSPSYSPAIGMAPCLLAVFYASTLLIIFPLLAIPILVMLYLSFIANRYMIEHVFVDSSAGYTGTVLALWHVRRFGWVLKFQPLLYGLILLSRNEWEIGGVSIGVAIITVLLSEGLTVLRFKDKRRKDLNGNTRKALDELSSSMRDTKKDDGNRNERNSRQSDLSLLNRVTALLPGYGRLPDHFPLPIPTERMDDLLQTERCSNLKPTSRSGQTAEGYQYFTENLNSIKGLIYPLEMLIPIPVIWLPRDQNGIAQGEMIELGRYHNLLAIVDQPDEVRSQDAGVDKNRRPKGKGKERGDRDDGEVNSPLLVR